MTRKISMNSCSNNFVVFIFYFQRVCFFFAWLLSVLNYIYRKEFVFAEIEKCEGGTKWIELHTARKTTKAKTNLQVQSGACVCVLAGCAWENEKLCE